MNLVFHGSKTDALLALQDGESLVVPCGASTVQSAMSSLASLTSKRGVPAGEFSQRKALLVIDETVRPLPVVLVTRRQARQA